MSAPLKNGQKAYLAQLARRAFNQLAALSRGQGEDPTNVGGCLNFEEFRHAHVAEACGKLGLRCATQDDYKLIEGHFLELLGQHGAAFNAFTRAATETKRTAEFKVIEACKEFDFKLSYAEAICRSQNNGRGLQDVDEKALWRIFYTVRTRGRARAQKLSMAC